MKALIIRIVLHLRLICGGVFADVVKWGFKHSFCGCVEVGLQKQFLRKHVLNAS